MDKRLMLLAALPMLSCVAQAAEKQPNILWIITDDQRPDAIECYNRALTGKSEGELGYVSSPNIDKLAQEGVLFPNAFCNSPASAPSRGSMHTGRYPHHSGIYNFTKTHQENDFAQPLIPEMMEQYGYNTASFGKTGFYIFEYREPMDYVGIPGVYQQRVRMEEDLERKGVTDWCKNDLRDDHGKSHGTLESWYYPDGSVTEYYLRRAEGGQTEEDLKVWEEFRKKQDIILMPTNPSDMVISGLNTMPTEKTLDGRITEEFCRYFDNEGKKYKMLNGVGDMEGVDPSKPQFIHLGFHFPHTSVMPSKEYRDRFKDLDYKIPKLSLEEYDKMPPQLKKWAKQSGVGALSDEEMLQCIRDYYAFCAMGDELVGQAVDRFKRYCKEKDQPYLIVYACGDHGWHLGEEGVYAKFSSYIQSTNTAVIVSSSDDKVTYPDGAVNTDLMEYVDFAPTFFGAAGADLKEDKFDYLDGRDLALTAGHKVAPRDYIVGEGNMIFGPRAYIIGKEFAFSMRTRPTNAGNSPEPLKDVKWAMECTPEQAEYALFDLRVDPSEKQNVAYDKKYAALSEWFRTKLGNIVLGDGRLECDWNKINSYAISNFAVGSDDKVLDIPAELIPDVE